MTSLNETLVENTRIVRQDNANNYDTALGGDVVNWMDDTGMISAIRFAGEACVTASIGGIDFMKPLNVGNAALIKSYVYKVGNTSIKTHVTVHSEVIGEGKKNLITEAHFIYVAVDENGRPTPVPDLEIDTEEEQSLREKAMEVERA